jgi:hypothetical protein
VGCRLFKHGDAASKKCLVLEAKKLRYQAAISDFSGSDIIPHHNQPRAIVSAVRNWLNSQAQLSATGPSEVWNVFNQFMPFNADELRARGLSSKDIEQPGVDELILCMNRWVARYGN